MTNWKTTLFGALGAAAIVTINLVTTGTVDPKTLATAAAIAFVGYFAKDSTPAK